jgi:hypothetical protein
MIQFTVLHFVESVRGHDELTAPIEQEHISNLLAQLGDIFQRVGHELQMDPKNGRLFPFNV